MAEEAYLDQLNYIHPKLRPYVKVLLTYEFGFLRDLPKIHGIESGCIMRKNQESYGDRFQLQIYYCRKPLNWHVIMNGDDVTRAPDFIMEENFLANATPETIKREVPSLANWCPSDVRCLLNVILELLELYKKYQVNLLSLNKSLQRYLFEYETLVSMAEKSDVEVCVQIRPLGVIFLIRLNVDFSKLPTALPNCKDLVVLVVEFKENAKSTIQLIPRIELNESLGERFELPELLPDKSLMDYVPVLEQQLQKKIEKVIKYTHQRKMLYSYLVQYFEPCLINGDNINFTSVSFLLRLKSFFCILNVHIPMEYPDSRPTIQLLPVSKHCKPLSLEFASFPYNNRMCHEEIARSIFNRMKELAVEIKEEDVLENFKKNTRRNS